ncbi:MAG: serine/threonine protein kinase [Desulfuromonas sp.]|nr:MAG: serine/threonine protein kinase [Desulfuromonas sp.]
MIQDDTFFPHPAYRTVLGYPTGDETVIARRLDRLRHFGVERLTAHGASQLLAVPVLGYGYCGVVLSALRHGQPVAIKLRRLDCRQPDLHHEARLLQHANSVGIGPRLHAHSDDIVIMDRVDGVPLAAWLATSRSDDALKRLLHQLLRQGFELDRLHLDHGALRYPGEHVLIDNDRITLIDFSHASDQRRPNNVTSLVQGLLWGTRLAETFQSVQDLPPQDALRSVLRAYKQQPDDASFHTLCCALALL